MVWRTTALTMSPTPISIRAAIDRTTFCDRPKANVPKPKSANPRNMVRPPPTMLLDGKAGHDGGCQQPDDGWRCAQKAGAPGPDIEDVARKNRQQCRDAAQQRGNQVERHGAQDGWCVPDETKPAGQRFPGDLLSLFRLGRVGHEEACHRRGRNEQCAGAIVESGAENVEHTAEPRADE